MRLHFATFVFDYASFSYFLILLRLHLVTFLFGYFISLLPHSLLFRFCISFNFLFLFAYVSDCLLALARTLLVTTSVLDRSYRLMMPWSSCKAIIIGLNGKKEIEHRRISMKNCAAQIQEQKASFFILWSRYLRQYAMRNSCIIFTSAGQVIKTFRQDFFSGTNVKELLS